MKYKLIVSDYDNTLCNTHKVITQRTQKAIKEFTDNGGRFVICTTRPYIGIKDKALALGLKNEIITGQGACIRNLEDDKIIFNSTLSTEECKEILDFLHNKSRHIFLCSDFEIKTKRQDYFTKHSIEVDNFYMDNTNKNLYKEIKNMDVNQIAVGYYIPKIVKFMANVTNKKLGHKYKVDICDKYLFNITKRDVSKGKAIEKIAKMHGINKDEIISFGDSLSDVSMFEYCGVGVAMGNAMKGLKEKATVVCGNVDDEGLAKFIEENCLDQTKKGCSV